MNEYNRWHTPTFLTATSYYEKPLRPSTCYLPLSGTGIESSKFQDKKGIA